MIDNPDASKTIADYERFGQQIPDALVAPELHDIEFRVWDAFWELSTERQMGMGPGPIPASKIREYARECTGIPADILVPLIRAMDSEYLTEKKEAAKPFSKEMLTGKPQNDRSIHPGNQSRGARRRKR